MDTIHIKSRGDGNKMKNTRIGKSKYFISGDRYQWILSHEVTMGEHGKTPGKKYLRELYFYSTINHMLHDLVEMKIRLKDTDDLFALGEEVKEVHEDINNFMRENLDTVKKGWEK